MNQDAAGPIRIANISGFYGDRVTAPREMVEGGPVHVLTGDYLAELTMLILWKTRSKDPGAGYATTFVTQMEEVLGTCLDRRIKVVANAGGLNPAGLAKRLRDLSDELGLQPKIAHVEGDDILPDLKRLQARGIGFEHLDTGHVLAKQELQPITVNAYLGAWGITEALRAGADVVVCPRVTDASLVVGPAAWRHGWKRQDWDRLAGAVVAGHVIECGPQATGGNYPFLDELPDHGYPGFPIAEVEADGSSVITKHPGTGGLVSVGTVTSQLLYEIGPAAYANPDVVAHFDTIDIEQAGTDRVRISGVRGSAPSADLKVALTALGGYRNTMTLVVTGLDVEQKAARARHMLFDRLGGEDRFDRADVQLIRFDKPNAPTNAEATAHLRVTVMDRDREKVGRRFSNASTELALAGYAGFHTTTPPTDASAYGVYWPTLVPADLVRHVVVLPDGDRMAIEHSTTDGDRAIPSDAQATDGAAPPSFPAGMSTQRVPLGRLCGARSGDKGGNANVGVWARTDAAYAWLYHELTTDRFRALVTEAQELDVQRYDLPNLRAFNFVIFGLLGWGVSSCTRPDPQAKGLGEYLRSRLVDVPTTLLAQE